MNVEDYRSLWCPGINPSPADEKKAYSELNETAEIREQCLSQLKQMIQEKNTSDLGKAVLEEFEKPDDAWLLCFLRARKFDVSRTYKLIEGYVTFHRKYPELVQRLDLDSVRSTLQHSFPGLLSKKDTDGRIVFMFAIGKWDQTAFPFDEVLRGYVFLLKRLVSNPSNQVNGFVLIENFKGYSLTQALSMRPGQLKKMVDMLQGAFPARFKGIHFIHQPWYFTWVFKIVKPFLKAKLLNRVHIHGNDLSEFYKQFDPATLPEDFGGTGAPYDASTLLLALDENK